MPYFKSLFASKVKEHCTFWSRCLTNQPGIPDKMLSPTEFLSVKNYCSNGSYHRGLTCVRDFNIQENNIGGILCYKKMRWAYVYYSRNKPNSNFLITTTKQGTWKFSIHGLGISRHQIARIFWEKACLLKCHIAQPHPHPNSLTRHSDYNWRFSSCLFSGEVGHKRGEGYFFLSITPIHWQRSFITSQA